MGTVFMTAPISSGGRHEAQSDFPSDGPPPDPSCEWTASADFRASNPRLGVLVEEWLTRTDTWREPEVRARRDTLRVIFNVRGGTYIEAQADVGAVVQQVLELTGLPLEAVSGQRVVSNADLDAGFESLPECVGVGEAADLLGVTKQRVNQLAQKPDFPAPVLRLSATPVWRAADVRRFKIWRENTGRTAKISQGD